jgi:hypothetical protein
MFLLLLSENSHSGETVSKVGRDQTIYLSTN